MLRDNVQRGHAALPEAEEDDIAEWEMALEL